MNILYIGPYRQENIVGYESLNFLLDLYDTEHSIVARSVFYERSQAKHNPIILNILNKLETYRENIKYDLLIQHGDINSITYSSKIPKHIYWPIINNIVPDTGSIEKYKILEKYGFYIYKNKITQFILEHIDIKRQIFVPQHISKYLISNQNLAKFNLGIYQRYQKYYTVVDKSDEHIIKNLIVSFIRRFNQQDKILMICIHNVTQDILEMYNTFIKNIYALFKINYSITKILIMPIDNTLDSILYAHNTGDIFIDTHQNLHYGLANKFKKTIITNTANLNIEWNIANLHQYGTVDYARDIDLDSMNDINEIQNNILEIFQNVY